MTITRKLVFIDNNINQQTGTFLLKAEIDNSDHTLWPGMLINIEIILYTEKNAITVPINAIQLDQEGNFVYLIENNKAKINRVEVSRQINDLAVISKGLLGNEEILVTIPPNLTEGMIVQTRSKQDHNNEPI